MQVADICSALLWEAPPTGNSTSLNPKYRLAVMFATTSSNWSTVMSCILWAVFRTFIKVVMWASELRSNDRIEILDDVWPNWSTILKSLFQVNLRNYWRFSRETFLLWFSIWASTSTTSFSLEDVAYVALFMTSFPTGGTIVVTVLIETDVNATFSGGEVGIFFSLGRVIVGETDFGVNFRAKTRPLLVMPSVPAILTIFIQRIV